MLATSGFHSESDFQLALALVLADDVAQLRLEKKLSVSEPVGGRSRPVHRRARGTGRAPDRAGAEVPKKRLRTIVEGEVFDLPASGAPDLDTAAIWRDVQRIERLVLDEAVDAGASITLTNYPFWSECNTTARSQAHEFRLWEGRNVDRGALQWRLKGGRVGERLTFESVYRCGWRDFGADGDLGFRYLVLQPSLHR
ncbi:hypothetical protein GS539_20220 [Rhodococcus hoagii]|nr:hypothetical protein [Prescottella equi]